MFRSCRLDGWTPLQSGPVLALLPLLLAFAGCTSGGEQAAPKEQAAAGRPGEGSVRERYQPETKPKAAYADEAAPLAEDREPGGFDFGHGAVAKRRPRDGVAADNRVGDDCAPAANQGIRVTWEALSVERDQIENPHFGRKLRGATPNLKIVLVSQDHPDAALREKGRAATREKDGGQVAVLPTGDMQLLVRGLRESGFYRVARPTGALSGQFDDDSARGRVTIEVKGESMTVLSMRGQGASPSTRDIPRVYSDAKQAVATMRNAAPTLNVLTGGKEPVRPKVARRGQARVLTEEEAATILGEPAPAAGGHPATPPSEDDWLNR